MKYNKGERVRHPTKKDWGIGQVLDDSDGGSVKIFFTHAGDKTISLEFAQPIKLSDEDAKSVILDSIDFSDSEEKSKSVCKNCGALTKFGENANTQRTILGWCEPCFRQSQRTYKDNLTGETRYIDELRTIDGLKHWSKPK